MKRKVKTPWGAQKEGSFDLFYSFSLSNAKRLKMKAFLKISLVSLKFFWHTEAVSQRRSPGEGCYVDVLRIFGGVSVSVYYFNKVESGFVDIAPLHCCSPVGLLHVCRASFLENTSEGLPLNKDNFIYDF